MSEHPKSVAQSSFRILGVTLRCHVLDDGRRIIEAEDMQRFFDALSSEMPGDIGPDDVAAFARWARGLKVETEPT